MKLHTFGHQCEKACLRRFANNKGADQLGHRLSLIRAFVICFLESSISKLAISEISIFLLVFVAVETGLSIPMSETPKTGFLVKRPIFKVGGNYTTEESKINTKLK